MRRRWSGDQVCYLRHIIDGSLTVKWYLAGLSSFCQSLTEIMGGEDPMFSYAANTFESALRIIAQSVSLFRFAVIFVVLTMAWSESASADAFAAQAAYSGGAGPVVWNADKETARSQAVDACRAQHQACSNAAAFTRVGKGKLFVTTCCLVDGEDRCVVLPMETDEDAGRADGLQMAIKMFQEAGLPSNQCRRVAVHGVRTGKRLKN